MVASLLLNLVQISFIMGFILMSNIHYNSRIIESSTMGKRSGKYRKNDKGAKGTKKPKGQWKCQTIPEEHVLFKEYYQKQLNLAEQDFNQFWGIMKDKLPVVFRVNPNCPNHEAFCAKIEDENFIKTIIPTQEILQAMKQQKTENKQVFDKQAMYEPKQLPKLELIKWYPGNVVYTLNTNKQAFKKSKILSQFHKYLQKSFDSGLISRQELVSMLPPLYLNIQHDDIVLDLCAAPGSKTSQILQMIYGDRRWLAKGCVIANDADYSRAQMLIHQLHRLGTTGMAVVNHPGQFLPQLYTNKVGSVKQKFQFDKILCDVPCSGDGATRKLPIKWLNWHTSDGLVLHPLQLSILMKAINLLKKGGYLVYSTCSLNPIENEAVVNALFQKVAKGLQLVDIHPMYGVKGRRGLLNWKLLVAADRIEQKGKQQQSQNKQQILETPSKKYLKEYENYEQAKNFFKIKPTMFPPTLQEAKKIGLDYTMRILPHDQNSGGFYVALLKKNQDFQWKYNDKQKKKMEQKGEDQADQQFLQNNLPQLDQPVVKQIGAQQQQYNGNKNISKQSQDQDEQQQDQKSQYEEKQEKIQNQSQLKQNAQQMNKQGQQIIQKKQQMFGKQREGGRKQKKAKGSKYETYSNLNEQDFQNIQKFYGLSDDIKKLLYVRSSQGQNASKRVLLISQGVRKFLDADTGKKIKLVNMGCQVFQKGKQSFAGNQCLYRLCQDGIHFILDYLKQRKIKVSLDFFKKAISIKSLAHEHIEDEQIRQKIKEMTQGSFCVYVQQTINGHHIIDALVGQNFKNSFHLMVSKQDQASLTIRYL